MRPPSLPVFVLAALLVAVSIALPAHADNPGSVSVADGPVAAGAPISGSGPETWSNQLATVDAATGSVQVTLPIEMPAARGQVQPHLALSYSSSAGDGDAGIGWSWSEALIERRGPSGLVVPTWNDDVTAINWDVHDTYLFNGRPLVPVCMLGQGCPSRDADAADPYGTSNVWLYRLQVDDGSSLRFLFYADSRTWLCERKDGTYQEFGAARDGSFADKTDPVSPHPYRWHLTREFDGNSNWVVYLWSHEQLVDIYDTTTGVAGGILPRTLAGFAHHTHIEYEGFPFARPTSPAAWLWTPPQRVAHVDVTSASFIGGSARELVRRYYFHYSDDASDYHHSRLLSAELGGRCTTPVLEDTATFLLKPTPTTTICPRLLQASMEYTTANPTNLSAPVGMDQPGARASSPIIVDLNADGFADTMWPDVTLPTDQWTADTFGVGINTNGGQFSPGRLTRAATGTVPVAIDMLMFARGATPGEFIGDGMTNFRVDHTPPWSRSSDDGRIVDRSASAPPYTLDSQTLSISWASATATQGGAFIAAEATTSWNMLDLTTRATQVGFNCNGGGGDINGDGLNDCLGSQAAWTTSDEYTGFTNDGILYGTKDRAGHITPLGAPHVAGTIPTGIAWINPTQTSPWRIAEKAYELRNEARASLGQVPPKTRAFLVADMDGDGLNDIVVPVPGGLSYWRNNADATFGDGVVCTLSGSTRTCDYTAAHGTPMQNFPVALNSGIVNVNSDAVPIYVHDVNGDGLADLLYPHVMFQVSVPASVFNSNGIDVVLNHDGVRFEAPLWLDAVHLSGVWADLGSPLAFADMNANGVDDIIVLGNEVDDAKHRQGLGFVYLDLIAPGVTRTVNGGLVRPPAPAGRAGLLTHFVGAHGAEQRYTYKTIPQLWADVRGTSKEWAKAYPNTIPVVTSATSSNGLKDAGKILRTVQYEYTDPIYDARERTFRGFRKVRQSMAPDPLVATDVGSATTTTFLISNCPVSAGHPCTVGVDNPYEALRALPLVVEESDDKGKVFLSTTHHEYLASVLDTAADGRRFRLVYPEQTDTYLYDTAGTFAPGSGSETVVDAEDDSDRVLSTGPVGLPLQASSYVHLRTSRLLDDVGNETASTDYGILGVDTPIVTTRTFAKFASWAWRPMKTTRGYGTVAAPPAPASANVRSYAYDAKGNLTDEYATLSGTLPLNRFHAAGAQVAQGPAGASTAGQVHVLQITRDGVGNPTKIQQPNGHCVQYTYDPLAAQLVTGVSVATGPFAAGGCGMSSLASTAIYDRGLGRVTTALGADSTRTDTAFDGFGRLSKVFRPDPTMPNASLTSAAVTYEYHLHETTNGAWQVVTTTLTSHGTAGDVLHKSVTHFDGFDQPQATLDQADTKSGDTTGWIASGEKSRSAIGTVTAIYAAHFWGAGTDPLQYVLGSFRNDPTQSANWQAPSKSVQWDAFGRMLRQSGFDGTDGPSTFVYHAVSADGYDGEQQVGGANAGLHSTVTTDGHGRVVATTSQVKSPAGVTDTITTQTTYLASGQPQQVRRSHSAGTDTYVRSLTYDTLNRVVENDEPNTSSATAAWRYAYDDAGDLVGTSDARGCGENLTYDAAGRVLSEDYSPCASGQPGYTLPDAQGNGTEAWYVYDRLAISTLPPRNEDLWVKGHLGGIYDRATATRFVYDGRGRATTVGRQIGAPGTPSPTLTARYAPHAYGSVFTYDEADRVTSSTTGADVADLLDAQGKSAVSISYTARGMLGRVTSGYGDLVTAASFDAMGRPLSMRFGDIAGTNATYSYDPSSQRLTEYAVQRAAPSLWRTPATGTYSPPTGTAPTSLQTLLIDDVFAKYDRVGNPVTITDKRNAAEWPADAQPVTRTMGYDALYRLTSMTYATTGTFTPALKNVAHAAPPVSAVAGRVQWQTFAYDWMGNVAKSDDNEHAFFERSLGTVQNGGANGAAPNQLQSASSGASKLSAQYDAAGNLTNLATTTPGCGTGCTTSFVYQWDEMGRMSRAQRWDPTAGGIGGPVPNVAQPNTVIPHLASADLSYAYDHGGNRVVVARAPAVAEGNLGETTYSVRVFDTLRLDDARWLGGTSTTSADYERTATTESAYLAAGGSVLARVVYVEQSLPTVSASRGKQHVLLQVGDHLGSTTAVVDLATSELVERSTYEAYGSDETDYRPARWGNLRESFRFTGKEYDVDVGLHYFGARYYSPHLTRWISADPLTVHGLGADLNPYAYVSGNVLASVDPFGLELQQVAPDVFRAPEMTVVGDSPGPAMDQTGMAPHAERPSAQPDFEPTVSDPTALTNAQSRGRMEVGDLRAFGRGMLQRPPNGDRFDGANEMGRQFAQNLALEGAGAVVAKLAASAPAIIRNAMPIARELLHDTRGSLAFGGRVGEGAFSAIVEGGGLAAQEAAGGHVLAKHVGQAEAALAARLAAESNIPAASTFLSRAEAEGALSSVMGQRSADIAAWVASGAKGTRAFDGAFSGGSVLARGASGTVAGVGARAVLRGTGGGAFFILTGFPL